MEHIRHRVLEVCASIIHSKGHVAIVKITPGCGEINIVLILLMNLDLFVP